MYITRKPTDHFYIYDWSFNLIILEKSRLSLLPFYVWGPWASSFWARDLIGWGKDLGLEFRSHDSKLYDLFIHLSWIWTIKLSLYSKPIIYIFNLHWKVFLLNFDQKSVYLKVLRRILLAHNLSKKFSWVWKASWVSPFYQGDLEDSSSVMNVHVNHLRILWKYRVWLSQCAGGDLPLIPSRFPSRPVDLQDSPTLSLCSSFPFTD